VNGSAILGWLGAQAHVAGTVLAAIISNRPAPARQVVIYTVALAVVATVIPKIVKLVSK
jgi:hypothetical protein